MNGNKIDILKEWLSWLEEAQFNHTTAYIPDFQQHIVALKKALIKNLSSNKKAIAACLKFINMQGTLSDSSNWLQHSNVPIINAGIGVRSPIMYKDFKIAERLIVDELTSINASQLYRKLLLARYNNCLNFEQGLAQIIIKNRTFLEYYYRYNFQSPLVDMSNTIATKIGDFLEISSVEDICNCLQDEYPRSCYEEFKQLLNDFINVRIGDELIKFDLNQITELDVISGNLAKLKESSNIEVPLYRYLNNAWEFWIKGDLYSVIRELWDAFENIKTLNCSSQTNKKQCTENFIKIIAENLFPNDVCAQDDLFKMLNAECIKLTELGNEYNIRHSEEFKINIQNNNELLLYLIKRMDCLLKLFIKQANL